MPMIGTVRALLVALVLPCAATGEGEKVPDVDSLLRRFDEMYESSGTKARLEIEITRPGKTRSLRMRSWSKGADKALIIIDAPSRDAGTATLKVERNLWNYLPKISRTIRVPASLMMGAWMGSDLTNDDLVRESSYGEDYEAVLIGPSEDPPGWIVDLKARPEVPGLWERVEVVFSQDQLVPVQSRYFDRKGRLARTMYLSEIKTVTDKLVATRIVVEPEHEPGKRTVLRYLEVEFDVELDEGLFSLAQPRSQPQALPARLRRHRAGPIRLPVHGLHNARLCRAVLRFDHRSDDRPRADSRTAMARGPGRRPHHR